MQPTSENASSIQLPVNLEVRVVLFSLQNNQLQTLLLPVKNMPEKWQIPGSPLIAARSLEETAAACLVAYIGRREAYLEQLYTYGHPLRDPSCQLVSVVYFALIPADAFSMPDLSIHEARWYAIENQPDLIGDHGDILAYALRRLRYKLEYTAAGFELLPENFSLTELQRTYEMILGEKLDKRNFRRRILNAGIIEPTPHQRIGEGRPARLFRYRPDAVAEVKARRLFP